MSTAAAKTSARIPTKLWGWGANKRVDCFVARPETPAQVWGKLDASGSVARGLGRSYGDAATNSALQVMDLTRMDRYLSFDPDTGTLECEAGISLAQLIADSEIAMQIAGVGIALGIPAALWASVTYARERFDIANAIGKRSFAFWIRN